MRRDLIFVESFLGNTHEIIVQRENLNVLCVMSTNPENVLNYISHFSLALLAQILRKS